MTEMKYHFTLRRVFSITGISVIVAGAIYALYDSIHYVIGPGGGDQFLLAAVFSLVFVVTGNRARIMRAEYRLKTS